jgi:hypothetical protein
MWEPPTKRQESSRGLVTSLPNNRKRFYLVGLEPTLKGDTTEREMLLRASSSIVHTQRLGTAIATIYGQSAQATSSYQRSEGLSGNQPDPLSGFIGLH